MAGVLYLHEAPHSSRSIKFKKKLLPELTSSLEYSLKRIPYDSLRSFIPLLKNLSSGF
jgi:hypothetical protein